MKPFRGKRKRPEIPKGEIHVHSPFAGPVRGMAFRPCPVSNTGVRESAARDQVCAIAKDRTSLLVGRRDLFVGGLRPGGKSVRGRRLRASSPFGPPVFTRPKDVQYRTTVSNRSCSVPCRTQVFVRVGVFKPHPNRSRRTPVRLTLGESVGVLCTGTEFTTPVGGAPVSGTYPTRLETRTKKSNMCASRWARFSKPKGLMKVKEA